VIYLDHNATTPARPEVVDAMARALSDVPGNPSSVHAAGRRARDAVERARAQVAAFLHVTREEVVFTSGGTEGDNLAIRGLAAEAVSRGRRHVVTSPLEHPAVAGTVAQLRELNPQIRSTMLPVSSRGEIEDAALEQIINSDTGLVTLALANHELGNVYAVERFAAIAHARGALIHTDAVQAAGKIAIDLAALHVDAATISAHKIGGPKGVGAVYVRRGLDLPPQIAGGHQERERRPGTENVAGIIGFGVACDLAAAALSERASRYESLRRTLHQGLRSIDDAQIFGSKDAGLPGTTMVGFSGAPGQLVAIGLDLEGICVSTGAACTSGSLQPSPVLLALGLSTERAAEGLRISFGWNTTDDDVHRLCQILPAIVARVRGAVSESTRLDGLAAMDLSSGQSSLGGAP
jgi:cysteine desulfurase